MKILFIDDDSKIRQTVLELLTSFNHEVTLATGGEEGIHFALNQHFDLVITDFQMPETDGLDVLSEIRKRPAFLRLPVIMLTGDPSQFYAALVNGADLYLLKPFLDFTSLASKIHRVVRFTSSTLSIEEIKKNEKRLEADEWLSLLRIRRFTGQFVISGPGNRSAIFHFKNGFISNLQTEDKLNEEAFDIVLSWNPDTITTNFIYSIDTNTERVQTMPTTDLTKPVEIASDTWWVGYRNPETMLQMNVYLRIFKGEKGKINYLIDPGAPVDFPEVSAKIGQLIGDISKVGVVSLNHQDPDVCMNTVYIKAANPKLLYICTEDTWRLAYHYDLDPKNVRMVNKFRDLELTLSTGHKLNYLLSPYCHFRGAFLTYDPETGVLFTGDLFAGLSLNDRFNELWATDASWEGMAMFHRIYMPAGKAIRSVIREIRKLKPNLKMIAPQHGDIIPSEKIDYFLTQLESLEVGTDLMKEEQGQGTDHKQYIDAINEVLAASESRINKEIIAKRIESDSVLQTLLKMSNGKISTIQGAPEFAIERLVTKMIAGESSSNANYVKSLVVKSLIMRRLPAITINWEGTESEVSIDQTL